MKILTVVGARPNFMKMVPLLEEMGRYSELHPLLVHTGQHYDRQMSALFFEELGLPRPDIDLGVGSGSHAFQTTEVMRRIEPILLRERPQLVLVVGDVNSTLAAALTAVKLGIPVAHVEAGLRSFDRSMPEEINRVLTDALSDLLFTTERSASENLLREGIPLQKIHFVGNVMIDSLMKSRKKAKGSRILQQLGLAVNGMDAGARHYAVLTLHRPGNVDSPAVLSDILEALEELSAHLPILFPVHPRTKRQLQELGLERRFADLTGDPSLIAHPSPRHVPIYLLDPLGYLDFLQLMDQARLVLTDSGGIQEETTVLGVPCLTLRENTERPVTITEGTNTLVGNDKEKIVREGLRALDGHRPGHRIPELWDGKAAQRIVTVIVETFGLLEFG